MGTIIGNFIALTILVGFLVASFFMPQEGTLAFALMIYGVWLLTLVMHIAVKFKQLSYYRILLMPDDLEVFQRYRLAIFYPHRAAIISAVLNFFRGPAVLWGLFCIYNEWYSVGVSLVMFYFISSGMIVKHNPYLYVGEAAKKGNAFALQELARLNYIVERSKKWG